MEENTALGDRCLRASHSAVPNLPGNFNHVGISGSHLCSGSNDALFPYFISLLRGSRENRCKECFGGKVRLSLLLLLFNGAKGIVYS